MVMDSPAVSVLQVVIKAPEVSFTVTSIVPVPSSVPSLAVSVRVWVTSALTGGAVNVVAGKDESAKVIPEPGGADHEYNVMASPSVSVADPDRASVPPSATVRSLPAMTVGGALALPVTVILRMWWLLAPKSPPGAVTLTA